MVALSGVKNPVKEGRGNPEKTSPAAVERHIKSVSFPAKKQELIKKAKENSAPSDVMHVLDQFEEKEYGSPIDIAKEVGRIE
ncbi:MAG: hypothetical protein BGO76_01300 [Caedibacter sp. 38-128]|nr:MAG: hypothetical protein BGO76_01300 [Caedibacter sp. 38-128]